MRFFGGLFGILIGVLAAVFLLLVLGTAVAPVLAPVVGVVQPIVAAIVAAIGLGTTVTLWFVAVFVVTAILYAFATVALRPLPAPGLVPAAPAERFALGAVIGMTASMNFVGWFSVPVVGAVIATYLAVACFLSVFQAVSANRAYQVVLGWSAWIMPVAWVATAVGLILYVVSGPIALAQFGVAAFRVDFTTGTLELTVDFSAITGGAGGFSLGNFTFLRPGAGGTPATIQTPFNVPGLSAHETGHSLNTGALGGFFLWVNAIDENLPPFNNGARAYGELCAESHRPLAGWFVNLWS